jgi:uncharacterized protein YndB with AHSA1/START domain
MRTEPGLTLKRRLDAPPQAVYAAWVDPAQVTRWFGPDSGAALSAEIDAQAGGRFHIAFRTENGERHDVSDVYREVSPCEKLVFTWAWKSTPDRESLVTIDLKPDGDGTMLTLTHEQFFDEAARDNHRSGWMGALDKLERLYGGAGPESVSNQDRRTA